MPPQKNYSESPSCKRKKTTKKNKILFAPIVQWLTINPHGNQDQFLSYLWKTQLIVIDLGLAELLSLP